MKSTFIVYWDSMGFESVISLSEIDDRIIEAKLKGHPYAGITVQNIFIKMKTRAQENTNRQPEIWLYESDESELVLKNKAVYEAVQLKADIKSCQESVCMFHGDEIIVHS